MKKNQSKIQRKISNTSFQTQLFLIILAVFAIFIVAEYLIVNYSFKGRYIKSEIENSTTSVASFVASVNEENYKANQGKSSNVAGVIEKFTNDSGAILVFLSNAGGGYVVEDSSVTSYTINVVDGNETYQIKLPSYQIDVAVGNIVEAVITKSGNGDYYLPLIFTVGSTNYLNEPIGNSQTISISSGNVTAVSRPNNLNYLYENNAAIVTGISEITNNLASFAEITRSSSSPYKLAYYYMNSTNSVLYCLYQPNSMDTTEFVLVIFSMVNTASLLSTISSYYGYIVLVSIVIAVLIALFISRAFSEPVKTIESEMRKLTDGDYKTSSYNFKNREMVSLQDTLNDIKISSKERVESINNQKQDLEKLNAQLMKEEELRSSFVARLSHELKTPLMVIGATTEALEDGMIPKNEEKKEYENILEEVDKTTGIIKDIIGTYKSSSQEMKLNITRFNLNDLVDEVIKPLLPIAQKNNLDVKIKLDKVVYMNADRELIGQVVSNLITNAFKYTDKGKVVEININDNEANFVFEVKNYGAHIKQENLEKIWLPFFRENENVDKSSTGMGLYIVREILNAHKIVHGIANFDQGVKSYFFIQK